MISPAGAGIVIGIALVAIVAIQLVRFRMEVRRHELRMAELDAIDEVTKKAVNAKTTEAYEHYLSEAARRLTEYGKKYP